MFQKIWGVIFFLAFSPAAWAYSFYADGIYYYIPSSDEKTVEVTESPNYNYSGNVTIPATVTYEGVEYRVTAIGNSAFSYCDGLTSVTIPESVQIIDDWAFAWCTGLTSITIGNGVTSIRKYAFSQCKNLTSVTIGKSVQSISDWAFRYCKNLTSVTVYNPELVDINIVVFDGVDCTKCKLYVPKGSVEDYRNAAGWSEFGEILPIDESSAITEIQQENADGHITVYNLQGVPVLETDDAADLKTLQNGAYIVNGKKMIIAR